MSNAELYSPIGDKEYEKPYVDIEEYREKPVRHKYIHGGFEGTNVKFAMYFPEKEDYKNRFFHKVTPVQGDENAAQYEDNGIEIAFAVTSGSYFVESNMGGMTPDPSLIWKSSSQVAEYSRRIASRLYGEHRPYGYIFGGSGGSFKTIGCISNTEGIWDGAVPFVSGAPYSMPNNFTIRVHAMRILAKKMPQIIDAIEPGSNRDMFDGLNDEERECLEEFIHMGFPPKTIFALDLIGPGALPVLTPAIGMMDPTYYTDFWTVPGYLGADPKSSASRARIQHRTKITALDMPSIKKNQGNKSFSGVDDAWKSLQVDLGNKDLIKLDTYPHGETYFGHGSVLVIETGEAAGQTIPIGTFNEGLVSVGISLSADALLDTLSKINVGDEVRLDNSDYLALQTYHRHQLPPVTEGYTPWNEIFRNENGEPKYPQRQLPFPVGLSLTQNGGGMLDPGYFNCKAIMVGCLMDESAVPWQQDWYRKQIESKRGDKVDEYFRLWYVENAMHGDSEHQYDDLHVVPYMPVVHQALLDVSDWVERGIAPQKNSNYTINAGQVEIPQKANDRKGIQPSVNLLVNGGIRADIKQGDTTKFIAEIELPENTGEIISAKFDFDKSSNFASVATIKYANESRTKATVEAEYTFNEIGTYFPVLLVTTGRNGEKTNQFARPVNLARVRVVVS